MMPKRGNNTLQSQAGHAFSSTRESSAVRKPPTAYAERVAKAKEDWQANAEASEAPEKPCKAKQYAERASEKNCNRQSDLTYRSKG